MVLQLSRHETYECFYYNCKHISIYDDEAEYLYFGGDSILKIVTVKDISNRAIDQNPTKSDTSLLKVTTHFDENLTNLVLFDDNLIEFDENFTFRF